MSSLLNVEEVKERYHLATGTIYKLSREGNFPKPIKIGGSLRWKLSDLEEFENGGSK